MASGGKRASSSGTDRKARKASRTRARARTGTRTKRVRPERDETVEESTDEPAADPLVQRRLAEVLRALPAEEFAGLVKRVGIALDRRKRIDLPAQAARALVRMPDVRDPSRLPTLSAGLLYRLADAGGSLLVPALPVGLEELVRRGIVYVRMVETSIELVLPTAFVVQLPSWEGEDPHSLRALLSAAPFETASAIASHFLGRPSTPPLALSLEPAWETLGDSERLRAEIAAAAHEERRLLDAIERVGGEVDSQELMDLEREPMRVRGAYGVSAGRRGAAFSLEKRGLLFPVPPNRYVLPTEVAAVVGEDRRRHRERRRQELRQEVDGLDHLPRRARFSPPPAPLALAMAMAVRTGSTEVKPGVGTPRSLVARLAQRFGREPETAALIAALSRAIGLWDEDATSPLTSPGCSSVEQLGRRLFQTWRRGGAWDEARADGECLRVPAEHRDPSPVGVLREMLIDGLCDLGQRTWVPYEALRDYVLDDPRTGGLRRLLSRWAERVGAAAPAPEELLRRMLRQSLPALGVIDVGADDTAELDEPTSSGPWAVRLTARGKSSLLSSTTDRPPAGSEFVEPRLLRVGDEARVADVLALAPLCELSAVEPYLELELSAAALAGGLASGCLPEQMRERVAAIAAPSDDLARALEQADTILGRATVAPASGFLWIEDDELREMLRSQSPCAELFVDPSPPAGLLVAPGVDPERLIRRCRAMGVAVTLEETGYRVRRATKPPTRSTQTTRRALSWRPPAAANGDSSRRSGSS